MDRRSRRAGGRLRAMALAVVLAGLASPATAAAQGTTSDLVDWNLTESTSTWPTQYHIGSTNGGLAEYRWLDTPARATVISGNACSDLSLYGSTTIAINDTGYKSLFTQPTGVCFVLRGRTTSGSGSMVNHDGRVRR